MAAPLSAAAGDIISIHTPVKGVTFQLLLTLLLSFYFNPHSREGSDDTGDLLDSVQWRFQSTLP